MNGEPAGPGPGVWINGEVITSGFSLTIETQHAVTVSRTIQFEDRTVYDRLMQAEDGEGTVTITREGPRRPGKRCIWGWRKGYIQVGSAADEPSLCTITIPKVRFA